MLSVGNIFSFVIVHYSSSFIHMLHVFLFYISYYHSIVVLGGDTVTFTKVPMIYHSWIHPFHHSPLSPLPCSWNCSMGLIYPFIYEYILSPPPSLSQWYHPPTRPVLPSCSPFLRKRHCLFVKDSYTGCFTVTSPCTHVTCTLV
jgi:hypothetical protein